MDEILRGRFMLTPRKETWKHEDIEKRLGLKSQNEESQVQHLKSKGGEILLNKQFFNRNYAIERINSVFTNIRNTRQMSNGFFMTMQIEIPVCKTQPLFKDILKKYGQADFIQSDEELSRLMDSDDKVNADIITHYYDYFGFEVSKKNDQVLRVKTLAQNYAHLRNKDHQNSFGRLGMKNLTTFYKNNKEVGRLYYFLEGQKNVISISEPPPGKYRDNNQELDYKGNGNWQWTNFFEDGSTARLIQLKANRMHGQSEGFYKNGQHSFVAHYKDGVLDGEVKQFNEKGEITQQIQFKNGQKQPAK